MKNKAQAFKEENLLKTFERPRNSSLPFILCVALIITSFVVLILSGLNAFNPPYWDEAWRMMLIQDAVPANNTTASLFFKWLGTWPLPCVRIFADVLLLGSSFFLAYSVYIYVLTYFPVPRRYYWCFMLVPSAFQLMHIAVMGTIHNSVPDYETFTCFLMTVCLGCFLQLRQRLSLEHNRLDITCRDAVLGLMIGLCGCLTFFSSAPSVIWFLLICLVFVLERKWKLVRWIFMGGLVGLLFYFVLVQSPVAFFSFLYQAMNRTISSGDSHSLKYGIFQFLMLKVPFFLYNSFVSGSAAFSLILLTTENDGNTQWKIRRQVAVIGIILFIFILIKNARMSWRGGGMHSPLVFCIFWLWLFFFLHLFNGILVMKIPPVYVRKGYWIFPYYWCSPFAHAWVATRLLICVASYIEAI
ncbi:MAG: hypothetical protein BWX73_00929 [Lentisphaerae bacterium ADurb.Bin082]|nr:MAG: hypothetical protein BWX73_00929 [Lentisphaerae bacterium ADurb.Bin082]